MKELRTPKTYDRYQEDKRNGLNDTCFFCEGSRQKIVKDFEYWKVVENNYPYDAVADISHLIFPKRHIKKDGLNQEEKNEFEVIRSNFVVESGYDYILEAVAKSSIPNHMHLHLLTLENKTIQNK